ncbi:MAG TPA: GNAT family N-acetyltransferase [Usitatibacter sp.]|jgi:GNAT superfamily N-acetyltransferase|nr:GNAT family N-acetyltransferase [Usitatibacter sp.]
MTNFTVIPVRLRATDRPALAAHFMALEPEDRRLRFGLALGDAGIEAYVQRIDFDSDDVLAVHDGELRIVAAIHVARAGEAAELGLSVLPGHRNAGVGSALFERAIIRIRNRGLARVYVHCLAENAAMMHIARKLGMRMVRNGGESDAWLELPPATMETQWSEWMRDQQASAVRNIRQQARWSRALLGIFG